MTNHKEYGNELMVYNYMNIDMFTAALRNCYHQKKKNIERSNKLFTALVDSIHNVIFVICRNDIKKNNALLSAFESHNNFYERRLWLLEIRCITM